MDMQSIIELVKQSPQVQQAVDILDQQLERAPIMPEDIDEIIKMLEAVIQDPRRYPEVRAAAIKDGVISEQDAPQEYDATFVFAVLIALHGLRDRLSAKGYARGGLRVAGRQVAAQGRGGDSMLAHINPREAEMLRLMGGSGTVNPNTGLREYKGGKQILGAILPIAIDFIAPGLGTTIGTALGASGAAASMLGSAVIGGLSSAVAGGNPLQGAILGGLGAGAGGALGGAASEALGLGLSSTAQNMLGGSLIGGLTGMASGKGFGKGALMGLAGSALGSATQGVGEGALGAGFGAGAKFAGNMLTAGFNPKQALIGGALSGLATGLTFKPSKEVIAEMRETPSGLGKLNTEFTPGEQAINPETGDTYYPAGKAPAGQLPSVEGEPGTAGKGPAAEAKSDNLLSMKNIGTLALLSQLAASRPPDVNQAIQTLPPSQQEYFNRPSVTWDWKKMQSDANAQGMPLGQYMAAYWPQITSGTYNMASGGLYNMGGGALGSVARLARGSGSGRDDTINARLSDGEYVMDAETVAMLGDGSTDAGAKRLDEMRSNLRQHKGKALSRGKFSPNAKSPLAYLKGAA